MEINAKTVKELREKTGAGMMDCKNALKETGGEFEKAIEHLRQKGLASADKKLSRQASEGLIESYIHTGGKLAVLVEVNCETDFVARRPEFQELTKNIAMQIAASPSVIYVSYEDIPSELIQKEREIELKKEDLAGKPEEIIEKIVNGRVEKALKSLCLFDQPFIKNQDITVEELVKQTIAQLGESIKVPRFARFVLGQYN
uniref:elongation factor Ts n=1 Tax=Chattonella marina TaxID=90936 RepID=UPI00211539F3|nr:elongation factor Ts [Chattonella marina]UTE94815.1 elongation factor Ts [Chattonella marina]